VDLTQSSLNSLAELVRKLKPIYDSILNGNSEIAKIEIESHSVYTEMPLVQQSSADTEMQDSMPRHSDQQTSSLPAPLEVDQNDTAICNKVAMDESGLSTVKKTLPKHESPPDSNGPKTVSAALFAQYDREKLFRKAWSANLREVAKDLSVASNSLSQVCKELHIPIPPRGFWRRSPELRMDVQQPELPKVQVVGGGTVKGEVSGDIPKVSALLLSRYNREELYRKAWQQPLQELAQEFGFSSRDVIAKKCRQLHIPIPGHFYWHRTARLDKKDWSPLPEVEAFGFVKIAKTWKPAAKASKT
jgi:hypothetical protein